ncbi:hypothetical protein [Sphingomonas morindae]|uniref:Uncharacterized protein n=1 Tax=Sphingomonas morindae TaxID=1541170 RepID=A0ABY4XB48_9SPHN|nr:hypothetical protein [Sphingomonas morindae]USI74137.1 hypothetical protein LHA26_06690 [Sphingomonas morindae]
MADPEPAPPRPGIASQAAWARYRRIMRGMTALALVCVLVALGVLRASGPLHLHEAIATALGVFFTVLVGTGLMSLAFLSSGSGHDAAAGAVFTPERPTRKRRRPGWDDGV